MLANCILFATFFSMGTFVRRKKTWRYSAMKVMEFGQIMIDILVYVSYKFEKYIFKIAQVISEKVRIAFLYVLSIHTNLYMHLIINNTEYGMSTMFQQLYFSYFSLNF